MAKISIIMLTYNHERYIRQALESVLMQRTEYSYQLLVGDDCSTDATQKIIREMAPAFQGKIKPVLRKKNLGAMANLVDLIRRGDGEYFAFLEGDDYWTDPLKLQKQVSFLEKHLEYVVYYHKNKLVDDRDRVLAEVMEGFEDRFTLIEQNQFKIPGQTATIMVRSSVLMNYNPNVLKRLRIKYTPADRMLPILALAEGKIYCSDEVMSAYRTAVNSTRTSWSKKYGMGNVFGEYVFFRMHQELERIGRYTGVPVNLKIADKNSFVKVMQNVVFKRKLRFILNFFGMLFFSTHRCYMLYNGTKEIWKEGWEKLERKLKYSKER